MRGSGPRGRRGGLCWNMAWSEQRSASRDETAGGGPKRSLRLAVVTAGPGRLACQCGCKDAREKISAADGGAWCWEFPTWYFAAEPVLDWYHAPSTCAADRRVAAEYINGHARR